MNFFYDILFIFLYIVLFIASILVLYFIIKTIFILFKTRSKRKHTFKRHLKHFLWHFLDTRYIKIAEFAKWISWDLLNGKDYLRLYGLWAFTGYYGQGKTFGCVLFANQLKKRYPHRNINIYSNIHVKGQVKKIMDWEELLTLPPNSIFIYDESQSDFSANNRDFPDDLLRKITQCRKRKLAMFMTSPRFNRMNINIRESVNFVVECKNLFDLDRWFKYVFYHEEDYVQYRENKVKLMLNRYLTFNFVVQKRDYKLYNTIEDVESIKTDKSKSNKKVSKKTINIKASDTPELRAFKKELRNEFMKEIDEKIKKNA